jgi:hypothetical protein
VRIVVHLWSHPSGVPVGCALGVSDVPGGKASTLILSFGSTECMEHNQLTKDTVWGLAALCVQIAAEHHGPSGRDNGGTIAAGDAPHAAHAAAPAGESSPLWLERSSATNLLYPPLR